MDEVKYCENTCREMTVREEIQNLDIDERTKDRIIRKVRDLEEDYKKQEEYLIHCHNRIKSLERALVETTCSMGSDIYNLLANR